MDTRTMKRILAQLSKIKAGEPFGWVDEGISREGSTVTNLGHYKVGDKKIPRTLGKELNDHWLVWNEEKSVYEINHAARIVLNVFNMMGIE